MMGSPTDNKKEDVGESSFDEFQSPQTANLEKSLLCLDEIFSNENGSASKDLDRDLVSHSSGSRSKRLSSSLVGRVSKFNANPTDGTFLSPMQSSIKKKVRNKKKLPPPLAFSPEPRRLHPTKTLETRIKTFDGSASTSNLMKIDLMSPKDVKNLVKSRDNQLGQILSQYERLAQRTPQQRYELDTKIAARQRRRRQKSNAMSEAERAEILRQNRARLFRANSVATLEVSNHSINTSVGDDTIVGNVYAVQCDFTDFVSPFFEKTEAQRNLILGVIERSFVFAEFRKYGNARCDGALEMLVDAFECVCFPSGHILLQSGMRKENDDFYLVERGRIEFKVDGKPVAEIAEVGGYFGELALLHSAVCERTVSVYELSSGEARLLTIDQKTFRGILNICSKKAAQEKREALLSVDFLSELIKENETMIRQLSSIMIREEMKLDGVFNLSQTDTFVVIRSGRIYVADSDEIFEPGDHFGSQALIQTLAKPRQNDIDMMAYSENVVFFRIENFAMGQIVGQSRLQNLMDMRRFASTRIIAKSNLSSDTHELMADTIIEKKFGNDKDTWEVDRHDPPAVYIVREGCLNLSTHDKSTGGKVETLVTVGSIFGMDQLKLSTKDGKPVYKRFAGLRASIPNGESTSIGVLPLNAVKVPTKTDSQSSDGSDGYIGHDDINNISNIEWNQSPSSILELRARVQEAVESNISLEDLEKIRLLGEGEFGEVWLVAANVLRGDPAAPKQNFALKSQMISDDTRGIDATDVILREIEIMKELKHPQIVDLVTTYQDETSIHMLMRLIPYGELWDRMHIEDDEGNWTSGVPEDHAKFYTVSIADTLSFIHSRGIVYRDLKPENVLIDADGYPVIVDLGCSKFCPDKTYTFVGTPNYVAPEMITNAGHNRGVDIWALGVVVYEMITGENPFFFEGVDQISLYHSICHEDYFPVPEDQSRESADFIDRLLKKDPLERLGMLRAGMKDILEHQWLEDIPLSQIRNKSYPAPWKPTELVRDGFENFQLENFHLEESMKSYTSIVSTEATEAQELSHSSRQDLIQDSITSFPSVTLTEGTGEIQKHSNSSSVSKPEDIQFSNDSETALEIEDPSGPRKPKKEGKKLKKKSRKDKEKEPKAKESPKSQEGSFLDKFYDDPSDFQIESKKRTHVIRNPKVRQTSSQKRERASRKDFLKSSFDNFGID
mmetsp:Transcript_20922/g.51896  ORF Transcript_20922/g.51896 Transcript_20922/m.51896 type:complete len:1184 (-) Transcript_20922:333-3884(-)